MTGVSSQRQFVVSDKSKLKMFLAWILFESLLILSVYMFELDYY